MPDTFDEVKAQRSIRFAQSLIESQSFVHFMDGYICDDIMNFDLANSILCDRSVLFKRYKSRNYTLKPFNDKITDNMKNLKKEELIQLKG
jgi:broad-specificity NMP kinase